MKRFKNILCFYHKKYDQVALTTAFNLAKKNKAKLTLMDVVDNYPAECEIATASKKNNIQPGCKDYLDMIVEPFTGKGVPIKTKVVKGVAIVKLVKAILGNKHDLVIASTLGSKISGLFWDSIALKLIRKSPVPVWIVKSQSPRTVKQVVAAVDLSHDKPTKALNCRIMEMASSLAANHKGRLTIVHGWLPKAELGMHSGYTTITKEEFKKVKEKYKVEKMNELKSLANQYRKQGLSIGVKLIEKKPAAAIADTVSKTKADVTVMGTIYRTGLEGFIMGNTAEETLPLLTSSLLAVKPDGFKTPVK